MNSRRTLLVLMVIAIVVLLALGAFALWLFGRPGAPSTDGGVLPAETGIVPVRVIDAFGETRLLTPVGIGAGSDGGFFVTLRDMAHVVEFDRQGDFIRSWGDRGLEAGQLMVPLGIAVDRPGGRVYVTDRSRLRLICYDLQGNYRWEIPVLNPLTPAVTDEGVAITTFGPLALFSAEGVLRGEFGSRGEFPGQFDYPRGIAVIDAGSAIIADSNNARVQRVQFSGIATATVDWVYGRPPRDQDDTTTIFGLPASVTIDDRGRAWVLDGFRAEVIVLDSATGEEIHRFVFPTGSSVGQLALASGIAYLGDSTFAITDTGNDRVQLFRLLLPAENTIIARSPHLLWLLLLPLLLLLLLCFRRRFFVTAEVLERAASEKRLRLLAAVAKKMYVLPAVYEGYKHVAEEDVEIGRYLVAADIPDADEAELSDAEELLARAAERPLLHKLLLARWRVVCADEAQCARFADLGRRTRPYDDLVSEYELAEPVD